MFFYAAYTFILYCLLHVFFYAETSLLIALLAACTFARLEGDKPERVVMASLWAPLVLAVIEASL